MCIFWGYCPPTPPPLQLHCTLYYWQQTIIIIIRPTISRKRRCCWRRYCLYLSYSRTIRPLSSLLFVGGASISGGVLELFIHSSSIHSPTNYSYSTTSSARRRNCFKVINYQSSGLAVVGSCARQAACLSACLRLDEGDETLLWLRRCGSGSVAGCAAASTELAHRRRKFRKEDTARW